MANFDIMPFLIVQTDRGPARRGAHIPNIRSENSRGNFFSVCTSTKRNACNCHGCSTSPTDKWRSGFKTVAWRRRSWTETDYSITHPTLFFRGKKQHCAVAANLCSGTDSVYRLSWLYIVFHAATALLGSSIQVRGHVLFPKKHELMWALVLFSGPVFWEGKVNWILSLPRERKGLNYAWYPLWWAEISSQWDWLNVFCKQKIYLTFILFQNQKRGGIKVEADRWLWQLNLYWCDQIMLPKG